jgi:hypothetical protein
VTLLLNEADGRWGTEAASADPGATVASTPPASMHLWASWPSRPTLPALSALQIVA